jgi:hypothetical protein
MTILTNSFEGGAAPTTVASGSNGGEISTIASWSFPSAGVLAVASTAGYPTSGTQTLFVAASGSTTALITYTGVSGNTFTGCAYLSGSATGTVATGGVVDLQLLVINTGGSSGNAFDAIGPGTGATDVFDNTYVAHGLLANEIATGASAASYNQWNTSGLAPSVSQMWFRLYAYFTVNPTNQHKIWSCTSGGSTAVSSLFVTTSGKLLVSYSSTGTTFVTFSNSIPLNRWFRVEGFIVASATVGQVSATLYGSMDSIVPTETHTSAANLNTSSVNPTAYNFGPITAVANVGPFWMDDVGLSSTGYLGPSNTAIIYPQTKPVRAVIPGRIIGGSRIPSQRSTPRYVPPIPPTPPPPAAPPSDTSALPSILTTFVSM